MLDNKKLDVDYIESVVQKILDKAHTNPEKRIIKRYPSEQNPTKLNFACPLCLDSTHKMSMKRGHLHLKNLYYVCYNERDADSMFFSKFCKKFNVELDLEKRMEIYSYLDQNWVYTKKDDFAITNMDKLINIEDFKNHITDHPNCFLNFKPITKGGVQWKYLVDRKIYNHENIWECVYKITDNWFEPVIVILNRTADKILGMQLRNLKTQKEKRIYKFYTFQEIHNMMHPDDPLDEIESISYNKLSSIFNILNVNFDDTIHVFEGYLDSIFFPNSIALVGLDTDISFLSNDNLDLKFVLDNDAAGQRKAKEMIDAGYSVFLWKRLFNNLSNGKGSKFKYHLESTVKDINKLAETYGDYNVYNTLNLNNYFAKDKFDLIDM